MTLVGMTGFGRASGEADWGSWTWEAKSVNGRGLDVRVAVPSGFEALAGMVKKLASEPFSRGNMQIGLRIEMSAGASTNIDETLLGTLASHYEKATGTLATGAAFATLMTVRGVVETGAGSSLRELGENETMRATLLTSAGEALAGLDASRREEGAALHTVLDEALSDMDTHRQAAEQSAVAQPRLIRERLEARLKELAAEQSVDADRLAAEVALTAAKADVREELDRLAAHIDTGRSLLAAGDPVGRKLDFLAQELNREANTLCSKSAHLPLTNAGLALKTLIDQFKEQAANVE